MYNILISCLFCTFIAFVIAVSNPTSPYYTAGVVEYEPLKTMRLTDDVNIKEYVKLIKTTHNLDILVFPEATLYEAGVYIPDPSDHVTPCDSNDMRYTILKNVSCAAREVNTYVVINIAEISDCTPNSQAHLNDTRPCAANGLNRYNTNIVFNRDGQIVARYRKYNLFGEFHTNTTLTPGISVFTTDFGVTFGQFICFDLLFDRPTGDLIRRGITNFVYSTMWFSEIPFLTAVQTQQNWAYVNNVNFLASGASRPTVGSTGSGIYSGRLGSIVSVMKNDGERKIYTARVAKIPGDPNFEPTCECDSKSLINLTDLPHLHLIQEHFEPYETKLIETKAQRVDDRLCHNGLCCDFSIDITVNSQSVEQLNNYKYRMAVFNGVRMFGGVVNSGVAVCGVIACINDTIEGCGLRFEDPVTVDDRIIFESILIKGKFESGNNTLIMPNSLMTNILPLQPIDFNFISGLDYLDRGLIYRDINYQLLRPQQKLLSFGIFSRVFTRDKWQRIKKDDEAQDYFVNLLKI